MREKFIRNYQRLLVANCLEELENLMCEGFLRHFGKLLPLEESFTDWMVENFRNIRVLEISKNSLVTPLQ